MRFHPLFSLLMLGALLAPFRPVEAQEANFGFELVGHSDLGARGMNAGLGIAGNCGYIGSRSGTQGTLVLDLAKPSDPQVVGEIPNELGSTPREVRAVGDLHLLIILNYRLDDSGTSPNSLDLYDVGTCQQPK